MCQDIKSNLKSSKIFYSKILFTLTASWTMILNTGKENMNSAEVGFREEKDVGL